MIVVEVHFYIAHAETHHLSYAINNVAPVLFLGIEKAVLRTLSGGVWGCVAGNARPFIAPQGYAAERSFNGGMAAERLVMIGDGDPCALWAGGTNAFTQPVLEVRREPEFCVSWKLNSVDLPFVRFVCSGAWFAARIASFEYRARLCFCQRKSIVSGCVHEADSNVMPYARG